MHAFLSYNRSDKGLARQLGGQLKLVGADVWFDGWQLKAGDSIPGKLNEALTAVDTLIVVWSLNAARSSWVRAELETAIARSIEDGTPTVIPVLLDHTDLPPLVRALKWIDLQDEDVGRAVNEIMGIPQKNEQARS